MPGSGTPFPAWLRALGNSRKCRFPASDLRLRGGGGQPRAAVAGHTARTTALSSAEGSAPHQRLPPRLRPQPSRANASGSPRLSSPLRKGKGGESRRPLTFGQRSGLLPAAAERHVTPRREGKASVVAANAVAPPFPLLRSSHLQAIAFQQVTLLH